MKAGKLLRGIFCVLTACAVMACMSGCSESVKADSLMEGIERNSVQGRRPDESFIKSSADFAVKLFKEGYDPEKSSLISPLSVMLALAMTANGAQDITLSEMERTLGGEIKIDELNEYLYSYAEGLPSDENAKLDIANSIWFRDSETLEVKKDFLQTNADYYNAAAYKAAFDSQTVKDINNWVKSNTDGMIDKIIDEIGYDTVMYLINALTFDAEWENIYYKHSVAQGEFTSVNGDKRRVEMMYSTEGKYIKDANAQGFIKAYKGGYSFAALLPDEGVSVNDYIQSLSGQKLLDIINGAENANVQAQLPKFSYDYAVHLNDALKKLGMPAAFDSSGADFSRLGSSDLGNIYIGDVLHKTFISVDERGTKAGAVTKVEMNAESAMPGYSVKLNRPFVYMIIDDATGLPIFIGAVMDIE